MGDYLKTMEEQPMILYSVNCKADITNYEWSIITIHKSLEGAEKAMSIYKNRWKDAERDAEFIIIPINTDQDSDIIYDCDSVNGDS